MQSWAKVSLFEHHLDSILPSEEFGNQDLRIGTSPVVQFHTKRGIKPLHLFLPCFPRYGTITTTLTVSLERFEVLGRKLLVQITFVLLICHPVSQRRGRSVVEDHVNSLSSPTIPFNLTHPPTFTPKPNKAIKQFYPKVSKAKKKAK